MRLILGIWIGMIKEMPMLMMVMMLREIPLIVVREYQC